MDARRKERISMAREICLHRGENPDAIDRMGHEGWEKYEPLAGACIRYAERLFAKRNADESWPARLVKCFDYVHNGWNYTSLHHLLDEARKTLKQT